LGWVARCSAIRKCKCNVNGAQLKLAAKNANQLRPLAG